MSAQPNPASALRQIAALNFFTFAARGFTIPFIFLYFNSIGFTGTEIGLLVSLGALMQLLVTPTLHTLADRTGQHRRLYYGLLIGNILSSVGLVSSVNKLWLSASNILRESSDTPGAALLSQLTITWLDEHRRAIYGRIRAWGSLGWAVTTFISGRIFALGGYPLLFAMAALCNLILLPVVRVLPERTNKHTQSERPAAKSAPRHPAFYILMVSTFLFYAGMNALGSFSFIYFKEDLGATTEMVGIFASVAALAEIPSMIIIDRLLRRLNIHIALVIGIVGQALLWLIFTALTDSSLLIFLMIVRGTFYTFQNVSLTLLVSRVSHPANVATNQALIHATTPALAVLLIGPLNGWLFDNAGPRALFQFVAIAALISAILLLTARSQFAAQDRRMEQLRQQTAAAD